MKSKEELHQKELIEWMNLILSAKKLGLTPSEIRDFLNKNQGKD